MRASSLLRFEARVTASSCEAEMALRIRVRKSAVGSVMLMTGGVLPGGLGHPRDVAVVSQLAQADPADTELAIHGPRAAAAAAARVGAALVLGGALLAHAL